MAPVRMNDPFASFIVPTYNRRRWIGECLDAINRQTYRNFEVIVIDDCSSDGTVEWLRSNPEYNFVRVCAHERNGGASVARYRVHETNCSGAANGVKVGREKLRCLRLALERNPEIRRQGAAVSRRLADVMMELAISCAYAGDHAGAARMAARAVVNNPALIARLARLSGRRAWNYAEKVVSQILP